MEKSKTQKQKKGIPPDPEKIKWSNRAYGYIRVSTKKQEKKGLSLEDQALKINAWGVMKDHKVVKIYEDRGITGTSIEKRPALTELLDIIKMGETLVTLAFSRLSRSARDFLNIIHDLSMRGCRIVIINEGLDTSTPYGRFTALMFIGVAQLESDLIKLRVKEAMKLKKKKGEFVGRVPYGWRLSAGPQSNLEENPEQQLVIAEIKRFRLMTNPSTHRTYSYEAIAETLNARKINPPGKTSKGWTHKSVSRVCNQPTVITRGKDPTRKIAISEDISPEVSSSESSSDEDAETTNTLE